MITERKVFEYVQGSENTIFKNLITYGIYCVNLISHVLACFYFL